VTDYGEGAAYEFVVPTGYKYLRMTIKGPQTGDRTDSLSIKRHKVYSGDALLAQGVEAIEVTEDSAKLFGRTIFRRKIRALQTELLGLACKWIHHFGRTEQLCKPTMAS